MLCILQGRTLRMVTTARIYMSGLTSRSGHMGSEFTYYGWVQEGLKDMCGVGFV